MSLANNKDLVVRGTELRIDRLISGLGTSTALQGITLTIAGTSYTVKDLEKKSESYAAVYKDARDARATLHEKAAAKAAIEAEASSFTKDLRASIVAALGRTNAELSKFGIQPTSGPTPLTSEEKALRAAKARATRQLRHTLGPKQKKALSAQGPGATVATTPSVAPAAPAATVTPLPSSSRTLTA